MLKVAHTAGTFSIQNRREGHHFVIIKGVRDMASAAARYEDDDSPFLARWGDEADYVRL